MIARRIFVASLLLAATAQAQQAAPPERTRENLMVVVRESVGANRQDDAFKPTGAFKARLPDGREVEIEMASWEFIGDTHVRFVFDGPRMMVNASPRDLAELGLKGIEDALPLAMANIRRVYGAPTATPWEAGLMQVQGKSPDLDSSYFLDRAFWQGLLATHPEGIVVSVAKRGGLLYTPLSNTKAVEGLKRGVGYLHASSDRQRISSALFLFKDGRWSVYQAAVAR